MFLSVDVYIIAISQITNGPIHLYVVFDMSPVPLFNDSSNNDFCSSRIDALICTV